MKRLIIPHVPPAVIDAFMKEDVEFFVLEEINWSDFKVCPSVEAGLAHDGMNLCILFRVRETSFRALITETNGPVYTDSCVELFISPSSNGFYYNLEFNAIGAILGGYGRGRDRAFLDPSILSCITVEPSLGKEPIPSVQKNISWELLAKIPLRVFVHDRLSSFSGCSAKGNIYKCGDLTPEPHYLSLWPVETEKPDFHRYEFFRDIVFE